ncbi:MAG: ATP-binding protein [Chloroflexi bacterium]|nr:ATP-binding protein [Chloroflexota bacterium]
MAAKMGFDLLGQTHITTCVSELTRNVIQYAKEGSLTITQITDWGRVGLELVCADEGQGIPDVEAAMLGVRQGNGQGLGLGLRGAKRLMDEFEIHSAAGKGTVIRCRKWLR